MRKSILATCALTAGVILAACGGGTSATPGSSGSSGSALVGLDYPRSDTDFWNAYIRYVPQKAKDLGVTNLKTTNSENDVAKLASNVQTLLSQGAKGIVMAPQDTAAIAPTLAQLAAKFGVPVCPHAGGVGLCEMVQHLAMFDYLAVSGSVAGRMVEYVDHLHEHFAEPVRIVDGHYLPPQAPGIGARLRPASIARFRYPDGPAWA